MVSMMNENQKRVAIGVRVLALAWVCWGAWALLGNLIETVDSFNPAYALFYLKTQCLRPVLAIAVGVLLRVFSVKISKSCARDLD